MNEPTKHRIILLACLSVALPACGDVEADADTDTDSSSSSSSESGTPSGTTGGDMTQTGDGSSSTGPVGDDSSSGEPDTDTDTDTGVGPDGPVAIWTTANPAGRDGDRVSALAPALDGEELGLTIAGEVLGLQSLALADGDGWATFDGNGDGRSGIMFLPNLANTNMDGSIGLGARVIRGTEAGFVAPKGLFITPLSVVVADVGAGNIKAFARDAVEGDDPSWVIDDLGSSTAVWDIHYDLDLDMLFAAGTNGELQVYENFAEDLGVDGPDRTIVPAVEGVQVSVNLHGVAIDGTTVYLTDVGDAMAADDGQIFVIEDVDTADGLVDVDERIEADTLGNPVDIAVRSNLTETALFVAEKANGLVLTFTRGLLDASFSSRGTVGLEGAESIALVAGGAFASANPAGFDGDQLVSVTQLLAGGLALENALTTPDSVSSHQSLHLMQDGSGWVTFDGPAVAGGAGVAFFEDLPGFAGDALDLSETRIWGDETGLVAPKGLDVSTDGSWVLIADVGAGNVRVYDGQGGNAAPLFVLDAGDASFWDVDYDEDADRVYAAGTDGTVYIFDDVSRMQGQSTPRTITPTDGEAAISVNLHGVHYDPTSDTLLLTDVGDAAVADDGQIFAITEASTAEGMVAVALRIAGDQTALGNPVDLAFDGVDLYVAEKANSMVLRYDEILDLSGDVNAAADASFEVVNAESVQIQASTR